MLCWGVCFVLWGGVLWGGGGGGGGVLGGGVFVFFGGVGFFFYGFFCGGGRGGVFCGKGFFLVVEVLFFGLGSWGGGGREGGGGGVFVWGGKFFFGGGFFCFGTFFCGGRGGGVLCWVGGGFFCVLREPYQTPSFSKPKVAAGGGKKGGEGKGRNVLGKRKVSFDTVKKEDGEILVPRRRAPLTKGGGGTEHGPFRSTLGKGTREVSRGWSRQSHLGYHPRGRTGPSSEEGSSVASQSLPGKRLARKRTKGLCPGKKVTSDTHRILRETCSSAEKSEKGEGGTCSFAEGKEKGFKF